MHFMDANYYYMRVHNFAHKWVFWAYTHNTTEQNTIYLETEKNSIKAKIDVLQVCAREKMVNADCYTLRNNRHTKVLYGEEEEGKLHDWNTKQGVSMAVIFITSLKIYATVVVINIIVAVELSYTQHQMRSECDKASLCKFIYPGSSLFLFLLYDVRCYLSYTSLSIKWIEMWFEFIKKNTCKILLHYTINKFILAFIFFFRF